MTACRDAPYFCRDGMISLEGCQGAPVIMSTPHFLVSNVTHITAENQLIMQDGDLELAAAIDGIEPVRELHETFLNLEPLSGVEKRTCDLITNKYYVSGQPMQAHKRIQISVPVLQSDRFDILNNVAEVTLDLR